MLEILRGLHIGGGSLALLGGVVALTTRKGSKLHRRSGAAFNVAMAVVCLTGLSLSILLPRPFLGYVSVLSAYFVVSGRLALGRKGLAVAPTSHRVPAVVLALAAVGWLVWAIPTGAVIPIAFGVLGLWVGQGAFRALGRPLLPPEGTPTRAQRLQWMADHGRDAGTAFIAAFTALVVVNGSRFTPAEPAWLQWMLWAAPPLVGVPLLIRSVRRMTRG